MVKDRKLKTRGVFLASDHAGYRLKENIKKFLITKGSKVIDLGPKKSNKVDYPDYAHNLSKKMKNKKNQFGILICGSGIGMSMAANRHKGIRAALCNSEKSAVLSRRHNNANVITLGSRLINKKTALLCIDKFLKTKFDGGRHTKRVKKI